MLEVELIENMQKVGGIFAMAPTTLLVVGSFLIIMVFCLLLIISSIIICQRKVQEKYGFTKEVKENVYTIGDE
jgi:sensor domain CHASE-containing protein